MATNAKKQYHLLLTFDKHVDLNKWCIDFGSYDKSDVTCERDDYKDRGYKAKDLKILTVDGDTQEEIDAAVAKFNQENPPRG